MNREIKFRAWDNVDFMSSQFTLQDVQERKIEFTLDCVVMQFTGLKDSKGVEIYEGDILQSERNDAYKYYVVFEDGSFCANHTTLKNHEGNPLRWGLLNRFNELRDISMVVIGNIHQDKHLLT